MRHDLAETGPASRCSPASPGAPAPSWAQVRLWFLTQLDPQSPVHNLALALRLRGALDVEALDRALGELLARHRSLRTCFPAEDGRPRMAIADESHETLELHERGAEGGVGEWVGAQVRLAFDLARGPLFRAALLRVTDADHVLVVTTHRIVCDELSLPIIRSELGALYRGFPTLDPVADYGAIVERQRELLQGETLARLLEHWTERLGRGLPVLDLPADRQRPAVQSFRGGRCRSILDRDTRVRLAAAADDPRVLLLAGLATLVHRYTGAPEIAVGLRVDGRDWPGSAGVVGPLENTLVLRLALDPHWTFDQLAAHVAEVVHEAKVHGALPFALLVDRVDPDRSRSHAPLFQVLVEGLQRAPAAERWDELMAEPIEVELRTAPVDLTLRPVVLGDDLACDFHYSTDLFDAERVQRLGAHHATLLRAGLAEPHTEIGLLPVLTPSERRQLLLEGNDTGADFPSARCLPELVDAQVDQRGEAIAAECGSEQISYVELERRANQLAHRLRDAGVGPDVLVALCLERSLEMLVAALGILKARGAYVPMDPAYPRDRLAFMLRDSRAQVVITSAELAAKFGFEADQVLCVDRDRDALAAQSAVRPHRPASPQQLAYTIYTSGSTGRPKGVQISHQALVNLLWAFRELTGIDSDDTLVAVTSLSFDIAGLELFLPLVTGARVVIATRETAAHSGELASLLEQSGATIMQGTPSSWRLLLDADWDGRPLRTALCGGEALPPDLAAALVGKVPSVWNVYGPTETTIWSCAHRLSAASLKRIPIGRPIANTEVYVLDSNLQPVPAGVPGELFIGGTGLARGYLRRPELNEARFIAHPFSPDSGARLYRTGDLASYRADGTIDFLGRTDHQVKVRGFRIELGEIEANLVAHSQVRAAVVVAHDDGRERRLVAYIVPGPEHTPPLAELRAWLGRTLPDYMLPEAIVSLAQMPLTPNGKVDRQALPSPAPVNGADGRTIDPRDRDERELAEIWQELLDVSRPLSVTEDFFALGGNSLLAARLLAIVERSFHRRLPLSVMFEDPTIQGLAAAIRARAMRTDSALVPVQPSGSRPPLFCFSLALGGVLALRHMLKPLGEDQPVLALLVAALPWVRSDSHIEDIAGAFAAPVLERAPEGPLFLFGHSLGGLVAYELAIQLSAAGHEVAPVVMVDTLCPSVWRRGSAPRRAARGVLESFGRLRNPGAQPLFVPGTDQQRWPAVRAVITSYSPRPYAGPVAIFATEEGVARAGDNLLGWGHLLTGETTAHVLPGEHLSILRPPHIDQLSARFVPLLRAWQDARP